MHLPGKHQRQEGIFQTLHKSIPAYTPLLIPPILHFHHYASASGTTASSVTPPASTSRLLLVHETPSSS